MSDQTDVGKTAPPVMRSWRNRLNTLRRSKTEPPSRKNLILKKVPEKNDNTQKCVTRSVSMKTMREIYKPKQIDQSYCNQESDNNENDSDDDENDSFVECDKPENSPAYSRDDIKLTLKHVDNSCSKESGDTPRSGVRVTISSNNLRLSNSRNRESGTSGKPERGTSKESCTTSEIEDQSSGDEECTGRSYNNKIHGRESGNQKSKPPKKYTSYQEFVIRPLVVDDYGPMLLRFLSWFDPMKSKSLTHPKFAEILLERKRKRHYTLIAVSSETGKFISLGSMIVVDNIFGPNFATGIIDALLIHPEFEETMLFDKMLIRLKEVAEMIPDVKIVRVTVQGKSGMEVIHNANSYKKLGRSYDMNLEQRSLRDQSGSTRPSKYQDF